MDYQAATRFGVSVAADVAAGCDPPFFFTAFAMPYSMRPLANARCMRSSVTISRSTCSRHIMTVTRYIQSCMHAPMQVLFHYFNKQLCQGSNHGTSRASLPGNSALPYWQQAGVSSREALWRMRTLYQTSGLNLKITGHGSHTPTQLLCRQVGSVCGVQSSIATLSSWPVPCMANEATALTHPQPLLGLQPFKFVDAPCRVECAVTYSKRDSGLPMQREQDT